MKRILGYLLPALSMLALVSCQTYNATVLRSIGNVAVVSVQCGRLLDTGDDAELSAAAKMWARTEDFDLSSAAGQIRHDVFSVYARSFPFTLSDERPLLDSDAYKGLASGAIGLLTERQVTVPTGYLPLSIDDTKGIKELIARFPDVNGFLWAEVTYALQKTNDRIGFTTVRMRADLTITILDRRGRAILRHTQATQSASDMRIYVVAAMNLADVAEEAARATEKASADMADWLVRQSAR
jgi:hypothetical protein